MNEFDQDFIEKQVKYRMGHWYDNKIPPLPPEDAIHPLMFCSEYSIDAETHKFQANAIGPDWTNFESARMGAIMSIFQDLIKSAIFSCTTLKFYGSGHDNFSRFTSDSIPIFSYNRLKGEDNVMLYQLWDQLETLNSIRQMKPFPKYEEKIPELIWRGQATGSFFKPDFWRYLRYWDVCLDYMRTPERHEENFGCSLDEALLNFDRYRFLKKWGDVYNIGFHFMYDHWNDEVRSLHEPLCKPPTDFDIGIANHKYHLVLDGNDFGSSMPATFYCKSVALMPEPKWFGIFHEGLEPWVHYVPVNRDASDLDEKVEWCKDNDSECETIVNNAFNHIRPFITNRNLESAIQGSLIKRYMDNIEGGFGWDWQGNLM